MDTNLLSEVAKSNLYTMGLASKNDPRQMIPATLTIPGIATRILRARLMLEEALEYCRDAGIVVKHRESDQPIVDKTSLVWSPSDKPLVDLDPMAMIDACNDLIYVAVGTLCTMGVPDNPHMLEVCRCNDAKFPKGIAIIDEHGKYQKPEGWKAPDHDTVYHSYRMDLAEESQQIIAEKIGE